jgi:hypothetical protein
MKNPARLLNYEKHSGSKKNIYYASSFFCFSAEQIQLNSVADINQKLDNDPADIFLKSGKKMQACKIKWRSIPYSLKTETAAIPYGCRRHISGRHDLQFALRRNGKGNYLRFSGRIGILYLCSGGKVIPQT